MEMKAKIAQAKKRSRKGFTLVELVIVIAILSILAAIAIPVITSTINSAKLSTMKSDTATLKMVVKECVNTSKVSIKMSQYAGKTAADATIADVCEENDIGQGGAYKVSDGSFFKRNIGGVSYEMVYTKDWDIKLSGGNDVVPAGNIKCTISGSISIKDLEP